MENSKFYNGFPLLSKLDINGKKPEIYICASNRSAGKTTFFSKYLIDRYLKHKEKFILLYRYKYELRDVAEKFFSDIKTLFFPSYNLFGIVNKEVGYTSLILNEELCGYAIAINSAENVKKYSHFFNECTSIFFDEFQSENDRYINNEIEKFISIHMSIARGQGNQWRYVRAILCGNNITILNPYYTALGISSRLTDKTRFLKGDGFVLEINVNESAIELQKQSGFNRAFSSSNYVKSTFNNEIVYLNDNNSFIAKPCGTNKYLATLLYCGKYYSVREYSDYIYIGTNIDKSFPTKIAINDSSVSMDFYRTNLYVRDYLKASFRMGRLRFSNHECKTMALAFLGIVL